MKVIDTDLVEAFLSNYEYYASVNYEIDKSTSGKITYEYMVYMMDNIGDSETVRFSTMEDLEKWLIENTRTL